MTLFGVGKNTKLGSFRGIGYADISIMHAPNNCAPPVPGSDVTSLWGFLVDEGCLYVAVGAKLPKGLIVDGGGFPTFIFTLFVQAKADQPCRSV